MKRLLGVLLLGLGALSMVVVSSAVPGGRSAHALGASSAGQTAKLWVGASGVNPFINQMLRYEVGITGSPTLDLTLTHPSFARPVAMAFSPDGEMFVMSPGDGFSGAAVSRFLDPLGTPMFNGTFPPSGLAYPLWGAFRGGELLIANGGDFGAPGGGNVLRFIFDAAGNAVSNGKIITGLSSSVRAVQVDPTTGELFVSVLSGSKINRYLFDASGAAIPNGSITGGGLSSPHDLAFSPWGELFVANTTNSISRFVFDAAGDASPNGVITGGSLNGPIGLDFSPWGELFVGNTFGAGGISRWVFSASFDATFNGSFPTPEGVADVQFGPSTLQVEIDIKPGSYPNSINVGSNGKVPVAILSSPDFDATTVDPLSVTLASSSVWLKGNGTPMASFSDVNGDGLTDIVVHVDTSSLLLSSGDTEAVLMGETFDGIAFTGTDTVRIVPQD